MSRCISCGKQVPPLSRFCPSCGKMQSTDDVSTQLGNEPIATVGAPTALSPDEVPTLVSSEPIAATPKTPRSPRPASASSHPSSSSSALLNYGRFLPGSLLADRYRVVALLGRGGMGEVYRADDLTLGQPVALKFLPEEAAQDPALLDRFKAEVRIARKVSHPNVCRVYDVGEVDGLTYLTMEYVDGEDLGSLLRRIGRLPHDKALDIARQLCAGLAAAHAKGVLHRDLKPANIMLDGRGQAIITDFGLAALADQVKGAEVRSGTPAYMAPEQLAGREVTEKSDIYALGLVLYELFTGKRAFSADNLADLVRSRSAGDISRPSSFVKDLDPLVERVILRCLEPEPSNRPASALSVAAALPGGDPLAAALAAGETPSPQMVAAAGANEGMRPRLALLCLAACFLGVIVSLVLMDRNDGMARLPLDQSPDVLMHRARDIVAQLGYDAKPVDSAIDFQDDEEFERWVEANDKPHPDWLRIFASGQPPILTFNYRQGARYLDPQQFEKSNTPSVVTFNDPPTTQSGMANLKLDTNGHLLFFQAIPAEVEDVPSPAKPVDWTPLFSAAGIDPSQLQPATPQWTSLADSDARAAWTGKWPGTDRSLRVEAAAWHGKPVFFRLIGPWTRPSRMLPEETSTAKKVGNIIEGVLFFLVLGGAAALARRQYKRGKGDRHGAFALALFVFVLQMAIWLCYGHFVPDFNILIGGFALACSTALFMSGSSWLLYMALEPYVRRLWPQTIISWTRVVSGHVHDPLVGRDVLFGVILGVSWLLIYEIQLAFGIGRLGLAPPVLSAGYLLGLRSTIGSWIWLLPMGIQGTLFFFIILIGLRYLLRNPWAAAVGFAAIFTFLHVIGTPHPLIEASSSIFIYGIAAFAVVRFGLITLAFAVFTANLTMNIPITFDFSRWYASYAMSSVVVVLAVAAWAFHTALGGQNLFKTETAE
jgi:predicted Ser/Thr protein kinase